MADEKILLEKTTEATASIKVIKMLIGDVVSVSEKGFSDKQPWAVVKQNVRLLGEHIEGYTKQVTAAEKTLKSIKGKKGALEKPGKDLDTAITTAETALKAASSTFKIHEKMVAAIETSDADILKKLGPAVVMGKETLGEMSARTIALPGEIAVIEDSFFAKGVPASAIKQPLSLLIESTKKLGAEMTTAKSVAESLAALAKMEPSVFESKALALVGEAKTLASTLATATVKAKKIHADALAAVTSYAGRLATMPKT